MGTNLPRTLSDDQLVDEVRRLAGCERRATAALIRALVEFDARKLYLREGCSSLFTYCTQVLHLSDAAAYNRIEAARAVRRFPSVLDAIEQGKLTLTAVRLLAPHLTGANHAQVLAAAVHRSRREVEELVAALNPRPPLPSAIRRLAPSQPQRLDPHQPAAYPASEVQAVKHGEAVTAGPSLPSVDDLAHLARPASSPIAVVKPVAPGHYRVHVTLSTAAYVKLRRAQALLRHTVPSGDPAEILDRALTLLVEHLERRRCAEVTSPRLSRGGLDGSSRHVPAAVRRAVWRRDEGRCAFVGRSGRCRETAFLEFHHVEPYAAGGAATVENIQLRCKAHNHYEAGLFFGEAATVVREDRVLWGEAPANCAGTLVTLGTSAAEPPSSRADERPRPYPRHARQFLKECRSHASLV